MLARSCRNSGPTRFISASAPNAMPVEDVPVKLDGPGLNVVRGKYIGEVGSSGKFAVFVMKSYATTLI